MFTGGNELKVDDSCDKHYSTIILPLYESFDWVLPKSSQSLYFVFMYFTVGEES